MTNRDEILNALRGSLQPLDDDQLSRRTGISPRQTVNIVCRRLASEGVLLRRTGPDGKIVNVLLTESAAASPGRSGPLKTARRGSNEGTVESSFVEPGSSHEQRMAEAVMLQVLSQSLGVPLAPRTLAHKSGARFEVDGAGVGMTVLVECWAHQGPAKVAQKNKLVADAVKLHWVAQSLEPRPQRLILCVSDQAAVKHLQGKSWHGAAIADLGVTLEVVELPEDVVASIVAAQKRQFR